MTETNANFSAQRLAWRDISLGVVKLANGHRMRLTLGLGSGLSRRSGEPKATVWAIADRGPNLKIKLAIKRYGFIFGRSQKWTAPSSCRVPTSVPQSASSDCRAAR
jgi:hypothetical protein